MQKTTKIGNNYLDTRVPGGVPTAHIDTYLRDLIPDINLQPEFDFSGVPELANYSDYQNAGVELLDKMVENGFGEKSVIHYEQKSWTYNQLLKLSNRIGRVLKEDCDLISGQRVLLRSGNTPMLVACWFAVLKTGGVCVTTMPLLRTRELSYIIERARVNIALCDINLRSELEEVAVDAPGLNHVLYFSAMADGGQMATLDIAADEKSSLSI